MKVFEVLYIFDKYLRRSIIKSPKNARYIISSYKNVSKKITDQYDKNKQLSNADIQKLNITEHMKNKIKYLITQKIKPDEIMKLKKKQLIDELMDFTGIGRKKADLLIKSGLNNISDLKKKKYKDQLNKSTILLMKYKPTRKIAHNDIKKIEKSLTNFPNSQLVGGFRRKKIFSKDIDVMITSNKKTVLDEYLKYLEKIFSNVHIYSKGVDKMSLIIKAPKHTNYYKIDVFRSPVSSKNAMLLYSTGSKDFNIKMRSTAFKMGYLLNQHGLYKKNNKAPIIIKSEKDFFNKLNMVYIKPENR